MKKKPDKSISKYEPPKADTGDTLHLGAKGILSVLPAASELLDYFVKPPMEKRLEKWREDIAQALRDLEKNQGIKLENLQGNERFTTIIVQATAVAMRNHQKEKLAALKNAVMNSALGSDLTEDLELIFVRFVEELTPTHLYLLKFLADNEGKLNALKSYPEIYQLFLSEIKNSTTQDEFKMLVSDLATRGLIWISQDIDDFEGIYQASSLLLEETQDDLPRIIITEVAKKFLMFISYSLGA